MAGELVRLTDGTPCTRLLRLNVDGSLDTTFAPQINSLVAACVINSLGWADGSINIGGTFDLVNGLSSPNVPRLITTGALVSGCTSPFPQSVPAK